MGQKGKFVPGILDLVLLVGDGHGRGGIAGCKRDLGRADVGHSQLAEHGPMMRVVEVKEVPTNGEIRSYRLPL